MNAIRMNALFSLYSSESLYLVEQGCFLCGKKRHGRFLENENRQG